MNYSDDFIHNRWLDSKIFIFINFCSVSLRVDKDSQPETESMTMHDSATDIIQYENKHIYRKDFQENLIIFPGIKIKTMSCMCWKNANQNALVPHPRKHNPKQNVILEQTSRLFNCLAPMKLEWNGKERQAMCQFPPKTFNNLHRTVVNELLI